MLRVALRATSRALALALLAAIACRAPSAERPRALGAASAPPALADVLGFVASDAGSAPGEWTRGRSAVYRVMLDVDGERRWWWMQIELLGETSPARLSYEVGMGGNSQVIESRLEHAQLTTFSGDDPQCDRSSMDLPRDFLESGLFAAFADQVAAADSSRVAPASSLDLARGFMALVALLQEIQRNEDLEEVLWKVIDKPGLLGILFRGGVSLGIDPDFEAGVLGNAGLPAPLETLRAWSFPLTLTLNDARALDCRLVAAPPESPLHLVGGLVRLEGTRPDDPGRRLVIELVGAR